MAVTSWSTASAVSWTAMVSTGWALHSTNTPCPCSISARTDGSNRTGRRRLVYQYPASSSVPSSQPAVTVEKNGVWPARGATGASRVASSSSIGVTCAECEA